MIKRTEPSLTLRQARTVAAVANHASLARASEHLNASQSSLSRYITAAERSLGHRLFQRGWLGMEPTSEGEIVIAHSQRVVAALGAAQATLTDAGNRVADLGQHLTWHLLDVVDAVLTGGSVSKAAILLEVAQPDVSRALAKLAAAIGREPFRRSRTGMAANADAIVLSDLRSRLLPDVMSLPDQLAALSREITGRVAVGLLPFSEQEVVAKVFGAMLQPYRHVRLQAVTGSYAALTDGLRRGELDFLLGPLRSPPPYETLEEVPLHEESFAIVSRTGHRLADGGTTLSDLARENWVVAPHGTPTRLFFEELLASEGVTPPAHTCEMVTFHLAEQMLLNSDAVGLLTYSASKRSAMRQGLTILPIDLRHRVLSVGVTRQKGQRVSRAQQIFLTLLTERLRLHS